MSFLSTQNSKILNIHLELLQFPILADKIRLRIREEMIRRQIISLSQFEAEVEQQAIQSQRREGLTDPFTQENAQVWERRKNRIRDSLTDFYCAYNIPHDQFRALVDETLQEQPAPPQGILSFNPELAPWAMLFEAAHAYKNLSAEEQQQGEHHLKQILVVLTKGLISDQLRFIGISREYFDIEDLDEIMAHRIGRGKIGGKAAGMQLAYKILTTPHPDDKIDLSQHVSTPNSYYIGADVFYDFLALNDLSKYMNRKYKPMEKLQFDLMDIQESYLSSKFPEGIVAEIKNLLHSLRDKPIIVRSSSLLEDRFETSFAGKYDSFFCANQGTDEENLEALLDAIRKVYASILHPNAIMYRKNRGLIDYDERMAILIQEVVGTPYKDYYFPSAAGVGFSRNPFRWNQKIDPEGGFLRLVWGLGTRAVDQPDNSDYPRMIALSHPLLRPETNAAEIRRYSQHFIDLIDMTTNDFVTRPITEVIGDDYPAIEALVSIDKGEYLQPIVARGAGLAPEKMVLTFENLLKNTSFAAIMRAILQKLERAYNTPVDLEFAVEIIPDYPYPDFRISILQCRPLNEQLFMSTVEYPTNVLPNDILFTTHKWMPSGIVHGLKYIVYVEPQAYQALTDYARKVEIGRIISRLNHQLADEEFILMGPGRWGSSNIDLGVKVAYADIFNTRILAEIAYTESGEMPEVSYGTHFFQDLVEARIYPLPIYPQAEGNIFNQKFFAGAKNYLEKLSPQDKGMSDYVKVIDVTKTSGGKKLTVVMDGEHERAIGYLAF